VKSIKFKGVISTGYLAPLNTIEEWYNPKDFKEGDEFTTIEGFDLCKKYKIIHQQSTSTGESRFNKKLKKFDKLVPNQFRFHVDTSPLAKNLHHFHPEDIIVISDKWHGTSAVFSNVLINKELTWKEKIAKFLGIPIIDKVYDGLYSSRSVIKNQYINKEATAGYYNEDIWKIVHNEIKDKIEQGISVYGEIVGYLPSGKMIQKNYDYGCKSDLKKEFVIVSSHNQLAEHKFLVYRITYTKPDGNVIEFSWNQIKDYCKKYSLETVKELYHGRMVNYGGPLNWTIGEEEKWNEYFFDTLSFQYLEKDCKWCINKLPAEGIVVRIDGKETFSAYKLKSKRFLEKESKQLDEEAKNNEVNIEDNA
jgi:hypothetical protein